MKISIKNNNEIYFNGVKLYVFLIKIKKKIRLRYHKYEHERNFDSYKPTYIFV